jgi:hypothetical protein
MADVSQLAEEQGVGSQCQEMEIDGGYGPGLARV